MGLGFGRLSTVELTVYIQVKAEDGQFRLQDPLRPEGGQFCLEGGQFSLEGGQFCLEGGQFCLEGGQFCLEGGQLV